MKLEMHFTGLVWHARQVLNALQRCPYGNFIQTGDGEIRHRRDNEGHRIGTVQSCANHHGKLICQADTKPLQDAAAHDHGNSAGWGIGWLQIRQLSLNQTLLNTAELGLPGKINTGDLQTDASVFAKYRSWNGEPGNGSGYLRQRLHIRKDCRKFRDREVQRVQVLPRAILIVSDPYLSVVVADEILCHILFHSFDIGEQKYDRHRGHRYCRDGQNASSGIAPDIAPPKDQNPFHYPFPPRRLSTTGRLSARRTGTTAVITEMAIPAILAVRKVLPFHVP